MIIQERNIKFYLQFSQKKIMKERENEIAKEVERNSNLKFETKESSPGGQYWNDI